MKRKVTRRRSGHASKKTQDSVVTKDLWQLPSGKKLADFALASGFLAPLLLESADAAERKKAS